ERLTESARRESFSSISSAGVREQFVTALSNLQNEVFADIERESEQNTIIHKRLDSAINSTDTRITQAQTATTTTVQYSSITPITMDSNATNSTRQQNAQHSNLGFSYEENIIDLDSPMEQTGPNVTPSRPIQTSSSGAIGNMLATGSASSHDSEDSNGFVRIEHPATDLLGDFDHPFGEVPLVPERSEHDVSKGEMTPSDEVGNDNILLLIYDVQRARQFLGSTIFNDL
ncbi:unnamed protein product, partial [Toxocara canis]|uniref:Autophagy-related protein 13 n=1 Tax=Toxocara canis TaxID=6265 RepID=A0A183VBU9_TOXCA